MWMCFLCLPVCVQRRKKTGDKQVGSGLGGGGGLTAGGGEKGEGESFHVKEET